jgi:hypothetical protein
MGLGGRHLSISMIFSTEEDSNRGDVMRFSTANTTPYMRAMSGDDSIEHSDVNCRCLLK